MEEELKENIDNEEKPLLSHNNRMEFYLKLTAISGSVIIITILFLLMYYFRQILGIFVLAFLLSYIISPAVKFFETRGLNRTLVVGLLYLVFIGILTTCALIFLPMIWQELLAIQYGIQESLSDPAFSEDIMSGIEDFQRQLSEKIPMLENLDLKSQMDINQSVNNIASWILDYIGQLIKTITGYGKKIIWIAFSIFIIPFITFFLLKDGGLIKKTILRITPARYSQISADMLQNIDLKIGRFIRGKLAESLILSVLTAIGLHILGIRYALVIGSIAGFANLIPYIGPVGIAIPPILLAIYQFDMIHAVITAIFLISLQLLDNIVLIPFIVGKSVDLHPLATMFVIFIGGKTLGLLGLVAAVPIASILISIFQTVYREFKNFPT